MHFDNSAPIILIVNGDLTIGQKDETSLQMKDSDNKVSTVVDAIVTIAKLILKFLPLLIPLKL